MGKNKPKNTSHRPKFPSRRLERNLAEPNGAHRDPPGGVQTPSVGGDRKKKFGKTPDEGPRDPLWRSFRAGPDPDRSGTEAPRKQRRAPQQAPFGSGHSPLLPRVAPGVRTGVTRAPATTRARAKVLGETSGPLPDANHARASTETRAATPPSRARPPKKTSPGGAQRQTGASGKNHQ